eukprot:TRINITY_DN13486_c0_g1_i3.p1 TRINITY_DN13486_c0_g1~~TRINITY_DN13486_c0_g1_i3.p1  ORF type:complete len:118 (-),score=23.44 TRINITY_DN13486_c0_g1_i3:115-468(-)
MEKQTFEAVQRQLKSGPPAESPAAAAADMIRELSTLHSTIQSGDCTTETSTEMVKTALSRFAHVSDSLPCPRGCEGATRYGYRVGDLCKYAAMERDTQVSAVLAYCPQCNEEFNAWL